MLRRRRIWDPTSPDSSGCTRLDVVLRLVLVHRSFGSCHLRASASDPVTGSTESEQSMPLRQEDSKLPVPCGNPLQNLCPWRIPPAATVHRRTASCLATSRLASQVSASLARCCIRPRVDSTGLVTPGILSGSECSITGRVTSQTRQSTISLPVILHNSLPDL